jgi:tRNA G10  N-methylase Trm11
MRRWYRNSHYTIYNADSLKWLESQRANSFHAVVTDPPFGVLEYTARELNKRRNGRGGIWRLPNAFDGAERRPMPRFTVLSDHDRMELLAFHLHLAPELFRVLVPGAHVLLASQCLVSHLVAQAFCMAGFEARGQIVRIVKTLGEVIVLNLAISCTVKYLSYHDPALSPGCSSGNHVRGE